MESKAHESRNHRGGRLVVEVIDPQDFVVTTLTETEVGYIIHDYPCPGTEAAEDGPYIRGFTYSADLAGQKFYQLTGVSLTEEEITGAVAQ